MAKKMNRGPAALSSAAILSVYGIGYALSQPAAVSMAAGPEGASATPGTSSAGSPAATPATSTSGTASIGGAAPRASAAATSTSSTLKDGTYTGSGSSRHGGVNVSVTIQNGRMVSAPITSVTTRYPQNVISGLPAQVVGAQSASVNLVSGATDSSGAYVQAVQQALSKAGGSTTSPSSTTAAGGGTVQVTGRRGVIYSSGGGGDF
ncbi:MAG TPA: FMN-binding protein [Chloroflexota bacterium]